MNSSKQSNARSTSSKIKGPQVYLMVGKTNTRTVKFDPISSQVDEKVDLNRQEAEQNVNIITGDLDELKEKSTPEGCGSNCIIY